MSSASVELMEALARGAGAAAVRLQAACLRSQAQLAESMAVTLDAQADAMEAGGDLPGQRIKLAVVPLDDEPEPDEPEAMMAIKPLSPDQPCVFVAGDGGTLSAGMIELLDMFDDRLLRSPHFVTAVNEAAEHTLTINHHAAEAIAARVRELTEADQGAGNG